MPEGIVTEPEDIRQLVGFLAGCGAIVRNEDIDNLAIPKYVKKPNVDATLDFDQVILGESLFRDKRNVLSAIRFVQGLPTLYWDQAS